MAVRVLENGGLGFTVTGDDSQFQQMTNRVKNSIYSMSDTAETEGGKMTKMFQNAALAAGAFFSAQQATQLISSLIEVRGEMQQLQIAFTTMLQSKEKADDLMAQMVQLAATTPFSLTDVSNGAKQLLAYGTSAEQVTDTLTMLGNVASGVSAPLNDIIYLYGTLRAQGVAYSTDIRQFAGRGIPIYAELAKVLGTDVQGVKDLVEAGKVGFPEVEKAFQDMTDVGGQFYNLMAEQSKSLSGQVSNLKDNITQMFNDIGKDSEGFLSGAISGVAYLVEHYREIGTILGSLVAVYGAYKAAILLTSAAESVQLAVEQAQIAAIAVSAAENTAVTAGLIARTAATNILSAATARLNAIILANPIAAFIAGAVALGAVLYNLIDTTSAAERAQNQLNQAHADAAKYVTDLKTQTAQLLSVINDETSSKANQIVAYKQLQDLYGDRLKSLSLEELQLKNNTAQQKEFNAAIDELNLDNLKKQYDEATKKVTELKKDLNGTELNPSFSDVGFVKDYQAAVEVASKLKDQINQIEEAEKLAGMDAVEKVAYYSQQKDALEPQIAQWEKITGQLKRAKDGSIELDGSFKNFTIIPLISQFNSLIEKMNIAKEIADKTPQGDTIDSLQKKVDALQATVKSTVAGTPDYNKALADYKTYSAKLENLKKALDTKTKTPTQDNSLINFKQISQQISDLETQYKNLFAPKDNQAANNIRKQFDDIILQIQKFNADPKNKIKVTTSTITGLQSARDAAVRDARYVADTEAQQKELSKQQDQYTQFVEWREQFGIDSAIKEFGQNTADYKSSLERQIAATKASTENVSQDVKNARLKALNELLQKEIDAEDQKNIKILNDALTAAQTQQDKLNALNKQYQAGRAALINNNASKDELEQYAKSYDDQIQSINKAFDKIDIASVLESTTAITKRQLQDQISYLEDYVAKANNITNTQKAQIEKTIADLQSKLLTATNSKDDISNILGVANQNNTQSGQLDNSINAAMSQLKQLQDAETQLLKDIQANGGKATDEQVNQFEALNARIAATIEYEKQLEALKPFASWSDALSAVSTVLGNVIGQFKGIDEGVADTLTTMKTLVDAGQNMYKSFEQAKSAIADINKAQSSGSSGGGIGGLLSSLGSYAAAIPVVGAAISGVASAVSSVVGMFSAAKKSAEEAKAKMAEYQAQLIVGQVKYNAELLASKKIEDDLVAGTLKQLEAQKQLNEEKQKGLQTDLDTLTAQLAATGQYISGEHIKKYGGFLGIAKKSKVVQDFSSLGVTSSMSDEDIYNLLKQKEALNQLTGTTKIYADEWISVYESMQDATDEASQLKEQITETFSGTTADSIAQGIVDGLKDGKRSIEDFGDDINDIISNSLYASIKDTLLSDSVAKIWKLFQADIEANTNSNGDITSLTDTQIAALQSAATTAAQQGIDLYNVLEKVFPALNDATSSTQTLSKGIKSITADQADLLASQFAGQRIATLQILDVDTKILNAVLKNLDYNAQTAANTAGALSRLDSTVSELKTLNSKIKSAADASRAIGG